MRLEGRGVALPDIGRLPVVGLEGGEFGAQLGAHRRQGAPRIDAEPGQCRAAELDILVGVVTPNAGDMKE